MNSPLSGGDVLWEFYSACKSSEKLAVCRAGHIFCFLSETRYLIKNLLFKKSGFNFFFRLLVLIRYTEFWAGGLSNLSLFFPSRNRNGQNKYRYIVRGEIQLSS